MELDTATARLATSRGCPDCEDFVSCYAEYTKTTIELSGSGVDESVDQASLELEGPAGGCSLALDPEAFGSGEPWTTSLEIPATCPTEEISAELLVVVGGTEMASICETTPKPEG